MLWHKGWLETRFRLLFTARPHGSYSNFPVFGPNQSARHRRNRPILNPCLRGDDLRDACGSGSHHATLIDGDERNPWLHAVHPFPACEPAPVAGESEPVSDGWKGSA